MTGRALRGKEPPLFALIAEKTDGPRATCAPDVGYSDHTITKVE